MIVEHFRVMCDYNYWANHQLWDVVLGLHAEDFRQNVAGFGNSIHSAVVDLVGTEWIWTARLRGVSPTRLLSVEMLPDRDAIRLMWDEVEADLRAYLRYPRETVLGEAITYTTTQGSPQRNTPREILGHLFNYSTDRRAHVVAMLRGLGIEVPSLMLLEYYRADPETRQRVASERFHRSVSS
ncbi:MAG: hypothetical protein Kow0077_08410 [Anaerolineae bacterium]